MPQLHNKKHENFCLEVVKDGNVTRAYQKAYPLCKETSADAAAYRVAAQPLVKARLYELFASKGLDISTVIDIHKELILNSKRQILTNKGNILEFKDNNSTNNALSLYYKVNRLLDNVSNTNILNQQINIVQGKEERDKLSLILQEITQLNTSLKLKESSNDSDNVLDNSDGE